MSEQVMLLSIEGLGAIDFQQRYSTNWLLTKQSSIPIYWSMMPYLTTIFRLVAKFLKGTNALAYFWRRIKSFCVISCLKVLFYNFHKWYLMKWNGGKKNCRCNFSTDNILPNDTLSSFDKDQGIHYRISYEKVMIIVIILDLFDHNFL